MNIQHHPSDELLLDYAAGGLGETWSLAIAAHLALCPACRQLMARLDSVGGSMVAAAGQVPMSEGSFDAVVERLVGSNDNEAADKVPQSGASGSPVLPEPLRKYLGGDVDTIAWQRLGLGAYQFLIPTHEQGVTARLLRIPAGRPVPTHSHGGLELTLVLEGAFSDATGSYGRGDLQEADETLEHRPHAAAGTDCVCLAVTDAPLRFKSLAARMVQPLIGI